MTWHWEYAAIVAAFALGIILWRLSRPHTYTIVRGYPLEPEHLIRLDKNDTNDWRCICGEWWIGPRSVNPRKAFEQHRKDAAKS